MQAEGQRVSNELSKGLLSTLRLKSIDLFIILPVTGIITAVATQKKIEELASAINIYLSVILLLGLCSPIIMNMIYMLYRKLKRIDEDEIVVQYLQEAKYALYHIQQTNDIAKASSARSL